MSPKQNRFALRLPGRFGRYSEMASDVAWSGVADLLIMASQTASFVLLLKYLSIERYGGYVGLYGVIGPIGALSWAGLALLVMQQIVREKDDPAEVGRSAFTMIVTQGIAATILAFAIASQVISSVSLWIIFLLCIVDLIITPITMMTSAMHQAIVSFPAAAKTRIELVVARVAVLVVLWAIGQLTLENLAISWIVVLGLQAAHCLLVRWPAMGVPVGFAVPTRDQLRTNLQLSFPLASSNLQKDGDKAVLNYFNLAADAGIYGAAFRIVWMAQMPIQSFNNALFHRFLSNDESIQGQHTGRAKRFTVVSVAVSVAVAIVIYFMAPLLPYVLGDKFDESVEIVQLLSFFLPISAAARAPLNGLLGLNATSTRAFIVLSSAALAMILYIALIPAYSWRGAVIGTIISEAYLGLAGWIAMIRIERRIDGEVAARTPIEQAEPSA